MAIDINQLANEINRQLQQYAGDVGEEISKAAEELAKEGAKTLKRTSPKRNTANGGKYAKGWRAKKIGSRWVVHNATNYQLTHLLEKGHAKVNGGRVAPRVHIAPVEQELIDEFVERVERAIQG